MFELGSCSVCVRVRAGMCQLWGWGCSCSPPGAAWPCPSPAASLSRVCNHLVTPASVLCPAKEGLFPRKWHQCVAEELLLCSSRGSAAAPEAAGPKSLLASGRRSCRVGPAVI